MAQLNQVPPDAEVWMVDGAAFLVWYNTRVQPPIPMAWFVPSSAEAKAIGVGKADRTFSSLAEFYRTGALRFGNTTELLNTTVNPLDVVDSNWDTEVRVKPWLADPEVSTLIMQAALEGRAITDAEMQGTDWWRTHSDREREWLSLNAADPATAQALIADQRTRVAALLQQAGVDNASPELVNLIADKWTQGAWTDVYATQQIGLLADPYAQGTLDPALSGFTSGLDTLETGVEDVRSLVNQWVGPAYASRYSQEFLDGWAGRLRNSPDAREELVAMLRNQRLALFPEYEDPTLTYEDIAAPWRGVFSNIWGQTPDETDTLFQKVVRLGGLKKDGGLHAVEQFLRTEGLKANNQTVVQNLLSSLNSAFGGQIRRADPAIV